MIFARRALQRRLNELRAALGEGVVDTLARRLDTSGQGKLAAMWELVVLHALSRLGSLKSEEPLPSGRRPDILFDSSAVTFTADIAAVSDEGLHAQNPIEELMELLEAAKSRLGLRPGGMDVQVASTTKRTSRGDRISLRMPERKRLPEFVRKEIVPLLKQQIDAGNEVLRVVINDGNNAVEATFDPRRSPYSSGSFSAYDVPTIKDRNPLYSALKAKARQLRGAEGTVGIIVGDANTKALAATPLSWTEVDAGAIVGEFFRQHRSIHFVVLISIKDDGFRRYRTEPPARHLDARVAFNAIAEEEAALRSLFDQVLVEIPKPIRTPVNAAARAQDREYGLGFHGGHKMSGNKIRISSREIMELLAGRLSVERMHELHDWHLPGGPVGRNPMRNPFELHLKEGRLPSRISVVKTDENEEDDWIEIEFGEPDPAIGRFR